MTAGSLFLAGALATRVIRQRRRIGIGGSVALITGGSRGLGLLIAAELGRLGSRIVLVARDRAELERARETLRAGQIDVSFVVADLGVRGEAARVVAGVIAAHGRLDILVNNAGVMKVGPLDHMAREDFEEAMAVHLWGPLEAMRAAIPQMRRQGGGRIVNISSVGGKIGVPHLVPYCASKFALTGLSIAAGAELAGDGIVVTTVCPGLMRTGSPFNARFKGRNREEFAWFAIAGSLPLLSIDGRRAAAAIVEAMRCGDAELVITWPARLAVAAAALVPNALALAMHATNRMLPRAVEGGGTESHSGWQSGSTWAPSLLTRLSERAASENNEVPPT